MMWKLVGVELSCLKQSLLLIPCSTDIIRLGIIARIILHPLGMDQNLLDKKKGQERRALEQVRVLGCFFSEVNLKEKLQCQIYINI